MNIATRIDSERGCGWRKAGGTYLIGGNSFVECGKLPVPLERCPTCDTGIKPSRGWTWVNGDALISQVTCPDAPCRTCMFAKPLGRCGLLWVGEKFYKTTGAFTEEALKQGISRRIHQIPRDFKLGETIVLFAHRNAILKPPEQWEEDDKHIPAIFTAFRPTAIEYVVTGGESEEELEKLVERGITPVKVVRNDGRLPGILEEAGRNL